MVHSLPLDILDLLLPLAVGGIAFVCGRMYFRLRARFRFAMIFLALSVIAVAGVSFVVKLPDEINAVLSRIGGPEVAVSWMVLLLLGIGWNVPNRSFSSAFLVALIATASGILFIQSCGSLYWRFCEPQLWQRTADENGALQQSTGLTCSPTVAVMFLHHYGVAASEGEMAYLAKTSLFGTDAYAIARALSLKVEDRGWRAEVRFADYEGCILDGVPFIAHIKDPQIGGHAIFVLKATSEHADVIDPIDGMKRRVSRDAFAREWSGTIIRIR